MLGLAKKTILTAAQIGNFDDMTDREKEKAILKWESLERSPNPLPIIESKLQIIDTFLEEHNDLLIEAKRNQSIRKERRRPKAVTAIEGDNIKEYKSFYAAGKDLDIHPGQIKMICDGVNHVNTGKSKKDGKKYKFAYKRVV